MTGTKPFCFQYPRKVTKNQLTRLLLKNCFPLDRLMAVRDNRMHLNQVGFNWDAVVFQRKLVFFKLINFARLQAYVCAHGKQNRLFRNKSWYPSQRAFLYNVQICDRLDNRYCLTIRRCISPVQSIISQILNTLLISFPLTVMMKSK